MKLVKICIPFIVSVLTLARNLLIHENKSVFVLVVVPSICLDGKRL